MGNKAITSAQDDSILVNETNNSFTTPQTTNSLRRHVKKDKKNVSDTRSSGRSKLFCKGNNTYDSGPPSSRRPKPKKIVRAQNISSTDIILNSSQMKSPNGRKDRFESEIDSIINNGNRDMSSFQTSQGTFINGIRKNPERVSAANFGTMVSNQAQYLRITDVEQRKSNGQKTAEEEKATSPSWDQQTESNTANQHQQENSNKKKP